MVVSESNAQARFAKKPGQAALRGAAMLAATGWLLAGCSSTSSMNPINWWHREQGGKIAEQRPSPPGADDPYPNISSVPAKPEAPDQDALRKLTDSLIADRTNAQHASQAAPLADPSSPSSSPSLFGVGSAPPPAPAIAAPPAGSSAAPGSASSGGTASASMPAVTAPPAPATPPSPAPRKAVQSAPLETPPSARPAAPTAQPALPEGAPTRPGVAGPAPAPTVTPAPMPAASSGPAATIVFPERASELSAPAADEVKAFAAKRGNATISVTGFGDSTSSDPDAQSAALNLGLARAQSIVDALKVAGVPGPSIRVSAEASGHGAALRLLQ
jgi:outer membrane protein OmpA-like peptidoglycan-associated protein